MNIIASTWSYWHSREDAERKRHTLERWMNIVDHLFHPSYKWITSGTISNPELNPLPSVPVITAGVPFTRAYDVVNWSYSLCAFTAGFAHALNRTDWDLLVLMDDELVIGAMDCNALLNEFMQRRELVLANSWCGWFCGCFSVYKREALIRYLYQSKLRPPLLDSPRLSEQDFTEIFTGVWWNPWPDIPTMRQDYPADPDAARYNLEVFDWPFIRMPHPSIVGRYMNEQYPKATPVIWESAR